MYEHHTSGIMSQYDPMFDLKIFVGHCDLYFMVQRGGGHIVFGADSVGVCVSVTLSCLQDIS